MHWDEYNNLGNRLLRRGLLTEEQLRRAVEKQDAYASRGIRLLLGVIIAQMGFVPQAQIEAEVERQKKASIPTDSAVDRALRDATVIADRSLSRSNLLTEKAREAVRRAKSEGVEISGEFEAYSSG